MKFIFLRKLFRNVDLVVVGKVFLLLGFVDIGRTPRLGDAPDSLWVRSPPGDHCRPWQSIAYPVESWPYGRERSSKSVMET